VTPVHPPVHPSVVKPAQNARFRQLLTVYANCLRQNGIKIPPPNTSGKGPLLSLKGVDTKGSQYKAAITKCHPVVVKFLQESAKKTGSSAAGSTTK
jgi:hypothetical protein